MDVNTLKKLLPVALAAKTTPLIVGEHGIGKSAIVHEFGRENGYKVIDIRLGQLADSGDLTGLPDFTLDELGNKIATKFMPPDFLPRDGEKCIIFLDELNRAHKDILQAVFQLVEKEGRIGQYTLPKDCGVIVATNPPTDDYTVTDFTDKAFADRFCHLKFEPSSKDFLKYARKKNFAPEIIDYLGDNTENLEVKGESYSMDYVKPSRRSWEAVDRVMSLKPTKAVRVALINGLVGAAAGTAFLKFCETYETVVKAIDVLDNFEEVGHKINKSRKDAQNVICDNLIALLDKKGIKKKQTLNLIKFTLHIDADVAFKFVKQLYNVSKLIDDDNFIETFGNSDELDKHFDGVM